jgi:hypothetical protein
MYSHFREKRQMWKAPNNNSCLWGADSSYVCGGGVNPSMETSGSLSSMGTSSPGTFLSAMTPGDPVNPVEAFSQMKDQKSWMNEIMRGYGKNIFTNPMGSHPVSSKQNYRPSAEKTESFEIAKGTIKPRLLLR